MIMIKTITIDLDLYTEIFYWGRDVQTYRHTSMYVYMNMSVCLYVCLCVCICMLYV